MQLYFSPGACSLASHIPLREAGLPFDLKRADTKTKKLEDGSDYYAINSKGAVPALKLDNGQVLTEGVGDHAIHRRSETRDRSRAEERHARALSRAGVAQLHHERSAQELLAAVESGERAGREGIRLDEPQQEVRLARHAARRARNT